MSSFRALQVGIWPICAAISLTFTTSSGSFLTSAQSVCLLRWQCGPETDLPASRLRFGVARFGRHLLIHGGHGNVLTSGNGYVARLNLHTLRWGRLRFSNEAPALAPTAFETGTPQAIRTGMLTTVYHAAIVGII